AQDVGLVDHVGLGEVAVGEGAVAVGRMDEDAVGRAAAGRGDPGRQQQQRKRQPETERTLESPGRTTPGLRYRVLSFHWPAPSVTLTEYFLALLRSFSVARRLKRFEPDCSPSTCTVASLPLTVGVSLPESLTREPSRWMLIFSAATTRMLPMA